MKGGVTNRAPKCDGKEDDGVRQRILAKQVNGDEKGPNYGSVVVIEQVRMKQEVGLIGGISLIVGTIIGSGIFISPKGVLEMTGSVGLTMLVWCGSGLIALMGGLCYSELGTLIKKSGAEYAYIMEAFGPIPAFLFSWTANLVLRTASVAIMALTFAEYMLDFFPFCGRAETPIKLIAGICIVTLMIVNCYSVSLSNKVNVFLTFAKLAALGIIMVGGIVRLCQGHTDQFQGSFEGSTKSPSTIALAFYQALWAYDGWNSLNNVTEEIEKPNKNLPRAIVVALVMVTVVFLLTNVSYLTALTARELLVSEAVAVEWGHRVLGGAAKILPVAVCCSTFGAVHATIFGGVRLVYVAGREGHLPELLSYIHVHNFTPIPSIIFTCVVSLAMIGISSISTLVNFFSFAAWLFYGTAVAALLVLRYTKRHEKRVVKVPIVIPIMFVCFAVYLIVAPIVQSPKVEFLYAALSIVGGLVFYIPLVHFKLISLDRITINLQLCFEVVPSPYVPED